LASPGKRDLSGNGDLIRRGQLDSSKIPVGNDNPG
jgi:hypothetical protein